MSITSSPCFQEVDQNVSTPPNGFDFPGRPNRSRKKFSALKYDAKNEKSSIEDSNLSEHSASLDELKEEDPNISAEDDITSIHSFVTGLKEMAKLQYNEQFVNSQGQENEVRVSEFGNTRKDVGLILCMMILNLPQAGLQSSGGDHTDSIYIEVELKRLSFLKGKFSWGHSSSIAPASSLTFSLETQHEIPSQREGDAMQANAEKERVSLYDRWGIGLNMKQRRLQLVRRLFTDTENMEHINESASLVAKLIGFVEPGNALKEMFDLSFAPTSERSYSWKHSLSSLM
ncbi:hypothetical protein IFM89_024406 [Coptis chinensis]|uniref:NPK1-activating kinesin-like protein C-terminal domain-containing protein n=1 Tax=Coptis chinensis TaxID=261450 RepID=A0A835I514_9MAGN|nr:hypothetical protein IFM89_024406 [Coptis chinensis]